MRKLSLTVFLLMALAPVASATPQAPDILIYNGKTYALLANPLEDYYSHNRRRPRFMIAPQIVASSAWRGYVATWEIIAGRLYLSKVDSWFCGRYSKSHPNQGCHRVTLRELFGKKVVNGRVLASWVSHRLRVPDGKEIQYVHMGYGSIYERDIFFEVQAGKVLKQEIVDNTNRKLPSYEELQNSELEKLKRSPLGNKPLSPKPNI